MAIKLQFDVGMNISEPMTGTKEIARAMASLQSTVKNVSKGMASSLTGYSDAIQRNVKATQDYNAEMRKLENAAVQIRSALAGVKEESVAFTILKKESKEAEANVARLTEKLNKLNSTERASGTTAFEKMDKQVEALDKKIDGLQSKLAYMKKSRDMIYGGGVGSPGREAAIKSTEKELARAQKERDSLQSKMDVAIDKDINLDTNIEEVTQQLEQAQSVLEAYNAQRDEMLANGSAYSDKSVVEMTKQLGELEARLADMRSAAMESPEFVESVVNDLNGQVEAQVESLKELQQQREKLAQAQDESAVQAFGNADDYDTYSKNYDTYSDYIAKNQGEIEELENRAEELRAQIEEIRSEGDVVNKASTLTGLEDELSEAESRLEQYYSFVEDWRERLHNILVNAFGSEESAAKWESGENALTELDGQIDQASEKIDELQGKIDSLTNAGGDLEGKINLDSRDVEGEAEKQEIKPASPNLDDVNEGIRAASSFLDEYMRKWNQMITVSSMAKNAMATVITPILHPIQAADRALGALIVKVGQAAASFARMAGNAALSFLRKLASEAQNAAIQLAKLASSAIHGAFQKLAQGASAAGRGLLGLIKNNKAADGSFKRGFMTIMKYAFGVRSMYFLFRRLRTAVKEAFTEMAKSSPEVKSAINSLQAALNGLKGSLATAFAPIFTAVAPALTYLINMLTAALNALGAFFAALTGQSSYKKAVGGMKAVGSKAGKSAKQVKELKRELLGFDELNIINGKNDNSSGGGGGGSGSGMKFVDEKIPGGIKDFVDRLKEMWKNGEFVKIGKLMADWINKAIEKAKELITWENVAEKIQGFVDAIAEIMEGLLVYVDWKNIGDTIAEALRTIVNTIDTFMKKVGLFMLAGSALAALVNGFFGNKKLWTDIGKTITDSVNAFLTFGQAFLDGFNETEAAEGIRTAILTVEKDLPGIAADFWKLVKTAFNKAGSFVNALLGGSSGEEQPDISRFVRPRPTTIQPKYSVDSSVWDELAQNLAEGFNTAIGKVTGFIEKMNPGQAVHALAGWLIKLKNGINWDGVGHMLGIAFRNVLDGLGAWIDEWAKDAETLGGQLAGAINGFVDKAFDGDVIADHFTKAVKSAFKFIKAFTEKLNEDTAAEKIREAITGVKWDEIAQEMWDAFKAAVEKLGNFLTVLFGGETDARGAVDAVEKMWKRNSGGGSTAETSKSQATRLGEALSNAIEIGLSSIVGLLEQVNWDNLADTVAQFIEGIDWKAIGTYIFDAFKELFGGLITILDRVLGGDKTKEIDKWNAENPEARAKSVQSPLNNIEGLTSDQKKAITLDRNAASEAAIKEAENILRDGIATIKIQTAIWEAYANGDEEQVRSILTEIQKYMPDMVNSDSMFAQTFKSATGEAIEEFLSRTDPNAVQTAIDKFYEIMNESGATAAIEALNNSGLTPEQLLAVATALGLNTEALTGNTEANQESVSATTENTEAITGNSSEDYDSDKYVDKFSAEWGAAVEAYESAQDAYQLALDMVKDGASPAEAREATNLSDENYARLLEEANNLQPWREEQGVLLQGISDAFTQLGDAILGGSASAEGGDSGYSGIYDGKFFEKNTKAAKKETKETQKNTKELKKNTAKRGEVDVNYEGAGFDISSGKPRLNVGVDFVPGDDEEASDENKNGGLLGWLQELLNADTLEAKIALIRDNWESVVKWMKDKGYIGDTLEQLITLAKEGKWKDVIDWFERENLIGPTLAQLIELARSGEWSTVIGWFEKEGFFGPALSQVVELAKQGRWKDVIDWFKENGYLSENIDQLVQLVKDGNWTGVIDWLTKNNLFGPKLQQLVDLIKDGNWTGVIDWLSKNNLFGPAVQQLVGLIKDGNWDGVIDWLKQKGLFGETLAQLVGLAKDGNWTGIIDWLKQKGLAGPEFEQLVTLVKNNWTTFLDFLGVDSDNPVIKTIVNMLFGKDSETKEAKEIVDKKQTNFNVKTSLTKVNWKTLDSFVGDIKAKGVKLVQDGWKKLSTWVGEIGEKKFSLGKTGWTTIANFVGDIGTKAFGLGKSNWTTISSFVGEIGEKLFSLDKTKQNSIRGYVGEIGEKAFSYEASKKDSIRGYVGEIGTKDVSVKANPGDGFDKTETSGGFMLSKMKDSNVQVNAKTSGGSLISTIFNKIGSWLFGKDDTPVQDVKINLVRDNWKDGLERWIGTNNTQTVKIQLEKSGWQWLDVWLGTNNTQNVRISLQKWGWDYLDKWIGTYNTQTARIALQRWGWDYLDSWIGTRWTQTARIELQRWGWSSLSDWIGREVSVRVNLNAGGGVIKDGYRVEFAKGGVIRGGMARYLDSVPHYASGTTRAHGTVFVAGESGPEVMGHINGRTEILNKAQIAEAMYSAVVHGMGQAVNAIGKYLANHMTNCTNSIIQTIAANAGPVSGVEYYAPAMATGGIMPYDVAMQIARSTQDLQNTLDSNNEELIQAMVSAIGNAAQSIVQAMATQMIRGNGSRGISSRQVIEDINRAGQMFGQSPIKGV